MSTDQEAIDWVIRMTEPDADWDAFTTWLEADPSHAARYDRAVVAMQEMAATVAAIQVVSQEPALAANDPGTARLSARRLAPWVTAAAAASVLAVVGLNSTDRASGPYAVTTQPGQQRTVALGDGSSIELSGGSSVRLDHGNPRVATVERGQMVFRIRHDAAKPFNVRVGDLQVIDLGTVFDVKATQHGAEVAVAEGAVVVDPAGAALRLDPGQMAIADGTTLQRRQIPPADVGGWREGRLIFEDAPLKDVAAELSRQLGQPIRAVPASAKRPFSGMLDARGLKNRPDVLGRLLGVPVTQDDRGWILGARG